MDLDYKMAFEDAPVGLAVGQNRIILACNHQFTHMFNATIDDFIGQTFERLYPNLEDFEETGQRVGRFLSAKRFYMDDRIMRRVDGDLFWVRVRGITYTPDEPHLRTLWVFTELTQGEPHVQSLRMSLTSRERDVATLLVEGKTGKEIAKALDISPRTVDVYRSRLLRKYNVTNSGALVQLLLQG